MRVRIFKNRRTGAWSVGFYRRPSIVYALVVDVALWAHAVQLATFLGEELA